MLLHEISLRNLLSFGQATVTIPLKPLNVFIGPNGSGKSNIIEAISLLQAAPRHLAEPVRDGGGIVEWLHKGTERPNARIEVLVKNPHHTSQMPLRHVIEFTETGRRFDLTDEKIENRDAYDDQPGVYFYYRFQSNQPVLNLAGGERRELHREEVDPEKSILAQRKDPDQYPEITYLGEQYERIRIYREWSFGRYTLPRQPQKADLRNDFLEPNCQNLALVLNRLCGLTSIKDNLLDALRQLYDGIDDFFFSIEGGTVQVFLQERGMTIPATRLSDGTLRYLCLLVVLLHPDPPPLVCIEEPELGLHPDIIPTIARLLVDASQRMQLIVTTHSDVLIDGLSEHAGSVVVCEKTNGATSLVRLKEEELVKWLERYRLGELWTQGQLGGTRW